jgi:hypothetical protein
MRKFQIIGLILAASAMIYAFSSGPDRGYTGAPGDIGTCVDCHDTFEHVNVGPGSVRINGVPETYQPGQSYTLSITIQDPSRQRWGFQMTAIDKDGLRAGTLSPVGGDTKIAMGGTGVLNRQYITHTLNGTFPGTPLGHTWQVQWTAPNTDIGTVRFYVAGNAANGDGTNQGDYIYTNSALSESPSTTVTLTLVSRPDNLTLLAGSRFLITWSATNVSNVESFELRYSTDDGMTFPITNLIFSTTDTSITSYEWTVPDRPTSQARIRLQAAKKSGAAVEVISGRFTITGSNQATPRIDRIEISKNAKRHLFVYGEGFQMGAIVELNGADQNTVNLEDFSHQLKVKKGGKRFVSGQNTIVVRNPDGSRSDVFIYNNP